MRTTEQLIAELEREAARHQHAAMVLVLSDGSTMMIWPGDNAKPES